MQCYGSTDSEISEYGLSAMLATGSDSFSAALWELLENEKNDVRYRGYRAWRPFPLSSLGPDWKKRIALWSADARAQFVYEVFVHGGEGPALTREFAETDADPGVRATAIVGLHWMGRMREVASLLIDADSATILGLAEKGGLTYLPRSIKQEMAPKIRDLLRERPSDGMRSRLLALLMDIDDPDCLNWVKEDFEKQNLSTWAPSLADYLNEKDAPWIAEWMTKKILAGIYFHSSWLKYLSAASGLDRDAMVAYALGPASLSPNPYRLSFIGKVCTGAHVDQVLAEYFSYVQRPDAGPQLTEPERQRMHLLFAIACEADPKILVDSILRNYASVPNDRARVHVLQLLTQEREAEEPDRDERGGVYRVQLSHSALVAVQAMLRKWGQEAIQHTDPSGDLLADIARGLANLGEENDIGLFLALVNRDVKRIEEAEQKRKKWIEGRMRGPNPVPVHYENWFVRAALKLLGDTESLLLKLLQTNGYEASAAGGLVTISQTPEQRERLFWPSFNSKKAMEARNARSSTAAPTQRDKDREHYRILVRQRLVDLIAMFESGASPYVGGWIRDLLGPFSALCNETDLDLVHRVLLESSHNQWARVGFLETVTHRGLIVPFEMALSLVKPVIEELAAKNWLDDQSRSLAKRALSVLLLSSDPAAAVVFVRHYTGLIEASYEFRELVSTLGVLRDEAAEALIFELMGKDAVAKACTTEILESLAASGSERARKQLLDWLDSPAKMLMLFSEQRDTLEAYASACALVAKSSPSFKRALFAYCGKSLDGHQRHTLASILGKLGTEEAASEGCEMFSDESQDPIPHPLRELINRLFNEHRPIDESQGGYDIVPRACNSIRQRIFEMATGSHKGKRAALSLLLSNESGRINMGRPREEPRHPKLSSRIPWPLPGISPP